jgi:hypothetical protein
VTVEGFVGSVGAPFDNNELPISVKVDDISESIFVGGLQTWFHFTMFLTQSPKQH